MGTIRVVGQPPILEWDRNGGPPATDRDDGAETSPLSDAQSSILLEAVHRASRVGLVMRTALFAVAILSAALAIVYTMRRGDEWSARS